MGKIIKLKSSHTMSDSSVELAKKRAKKKYNDYLKKNPTIEYYSPPTKP